MYFSSRNEKRLPQLVLVRLVSYLCFRGLSFWIELYSLADRGRTDGDRLSILTSWMVLGDSKFECIESMRFSKAYEALAGIAEKENNLSPLPDITPIRRHLEPQPNNELDLLDSIPSRQDLLRNLSSLSITQCVIFWGCCTQLIIDRTPMIPKDTESSMFKSCDTRIEFYEIRTPHNMVKVGWVPLLTKGGAQKPDLFKFVATSVAFSERWPWNYRKDPESGTRFEHICLSGIMLDAIEDKKGLYRLIPSARVQVIVANWLEMALEKEVIQLI